MKFFVSAIMLTFLLAPAAPAGAIVPALGAWDTRPADEEAAPGHNDRAWQAFGVERPPVPDAGGDVYTWYRATVTAPANGSYQMGIRNAPKRARVYINGAPATGPDRPNRMVDLKKGRNHIAILTVNDGAEAAPRPFGPVTLSSSPIRTTAVTDWRWSAASSAEAAERLAAATEADRAGWKVSRSGQATLGDGSRWGVYAVVLPAMPGWGREVWFESVDDNATVYLNGRRVGAHAGWDDPFGVSLDAGWRSDAPNTLTVVVENTGGQGGIMGPVEVRSYTDKGNPSDPKPIAAWKMRAGLSPFDASAGWQPFHLVTGRPAYYRTHFTLPTDGAPAPALRFETGPLGQGLVWLNGQKVGRYPVGKGLTRLRLPSESLKPGRNTLIVFDENGRMPTGARLVADQTGYH